MAVSKADLLAPKREEVSLEPLGLPGSVWVRSLGAAARVAYIDSLFDKDGNYQKNGGVRERLLVLTVERREGDAFEPFFATEAEAAEMRPDVSEVLFDVAQRLSLIREADRQALKNAFSAVPSGAGPTV